MTEEAGCALLKSRFEAAGYAIAQRYLFDEEGVRVELDGFDPGARVGYEYLTAEAGDQFELTAEVVASLEARMAKSELFLLLIDEADAPSEQLLGMAADHFLAAVGKRRPAR